MIPEVRGLLFHENEINQIYKKAFIVSWQSRDDNIPPIPNNFRNVAEKLRENK